MLRWALALAAALAATAAMAQVSGSASVVSDDRVRGVTLSAGRPAAQLGLAYDDPSGLYVGAFGSSVQFYEHSKREVELTGYTGYARRLSGGWTVDAGAAYTGFSGGNGYNYTELHAGVTASAVTARLYFSPNYFGQSIHTVYGELNGSYRLSERFGLIGHAGVLQAFSGATQQSGGTHPHADFLAGVEARFQPFTLQLSRIAADGASRVYPVGANHPAGVWTARLSVAF
ncbi:MAG TPA: TorF family putative porin [Burkholderiaceae bacterium]|nr:TorF family putative porin [Burkholderiaceae bacterium]